MASRDLVSVDVVVVRETLECDRVLREKGCRMLVFDMLTAFFSQRYNASDCTRLELEVKSL